MCVLPKWKQWKKAQKFALHLLPFNQINSDNLFELSQMILFLVLTGEISYRSFQKIFLKIFIVLIVLSKVRHDKSYLNFLSTLPCRPSTCRSKFLNFLGFIFSSQFNTFSEKSKYTNTCKGHLASKIFSCLLIYMNILYFFSFLIGLDSI